MDVLRFLEQEDLVAVSLVSKQCSEDCRDDANKNKIVPVYEINSRPRFAPVAFLRKLCHNQVNETEKLARYPRVIIRGSLQRGISDRELAAITVREDRRIRIDVVSSLEIYMPKQTAVHKSVACAIVRLFPNLREADFANISLYGNRSGTFELLRYNPLMEKLTCHGSEHFFLDGRDFRRCRVLTDIIMDDSYFEIVNGNHVDAERDAEMRNDKIEALSDLDGHDKHFIFRYCRSVERLSIRNAKWHGGSRRTMLHQNALIKFVRHAPSSLRWFRSDLSQWNIDMLQRERPGIELVN